MLQILDAVLVILFGLLNGYLILCVQDQVFNVRISRLRDELYKNQQQMIVDNKRYNQLRAELEEKLKCLKDQHTT